MPTTDCSDHGPQALKDAIGGDSLAPGATHSLQERACAPTIAFLLPLFFSACTMQKDTFDSDTWKAQRGVSAKDNKRIDMVPKLKASVRAGMPRADVIGLLGEPDSRNRETDADRYFLGLPFGPDEQYCEIRCLNGVVSTLRLGQF